ncbi:unnamed protein product [Orchesella dallaii]|uniref:Uncharacterized protein n=1 Tax=Orchesella dallaii TaxID=48710 RepID=A0ABP1S865_9HEXA
MTNPLIYRQHQNRIENPFFLGTVQEVMPMLMTVLKKKSQSEMWLVLLQGNKGEGVPGCQLAPNASAVEQVHRFPALVPQTVVPKLWWIDQNEARR